MATGGSGSQVGLDVVQTKPARGVAVSGGRAAKQRPNPGHELIGAEGLCEVVVRAYVQRHNLVRLFLPHG
jgi:hypothetical protein